MICSIDDCGKPVEKGRSHCRGHRGRKQRGKTVSGELRERALHPVEAYARAALRYRDELETATNEEWEATRAVLRMTLNRAYRAYLEKLTKLRGPRAVLVEDLGAGVKRVTFREQPPRRRKAR